MFGLPFSIIFIIIDIHQENREAKAYADFKAANSESINWSCYSSGISSKIYFSNSFYIYSIYF